MLIRPVYTAAVRLLHALAHVTPAAGESKLARAIRARRGLIQSYQDWARRERDPARPLLWFHAPSVGEGLQAQPVIRLLRARRPEAQIAYTFFSPSAEPFAAGIPADFRAYLPFDHPRDCESALAALLPAAIVFCRADVWPNLVDAAAARGVTLGVVSATLPAGSARLRPPAATLLREAFSHIHAVGAIGAGDAERVRSLGVPAERVTVTGDTRFDQVWERAQRPAPESVIAHATDRPTLVAGSTWPSDEEVLLPVLRALRSDFPGLRTIIAPHEITESRVRALEQSVGDGARVARTTSSGMPPPGSQQVASADVLIVDEYGVLGDLYGLADIAFVGGGFHRAGLHSVLEPAAFGAPVLFGPHHATRREAQLLIDAGGARSARGRGELEQLLRDWLRDPAARALAGDAARSFVQAGLGAAERSYTLVAGLLELSGSDPER